MVKVKWFEKEKTLGDSNVKKLITNMLKNIKNNMTWHHICTLSVSLSWKLLSSPGPQVHSDYSSTEHQQQDTEHWASHFEEGGVNPKGLHVH